MNDEIFARIKIELERKWCTESSMNKERQEFFWKGVKAGLEELAIQMKPSKNPKVAGNPVLPSSYIFRQLKETRPNDTEFYSRYYSGDYYNTAYTDYYNQDGELVYTENHKTYG